MTLALKYAARSDRGLVRQNNEDSAYAGPRLLALADGMGGHAAGEVASQITIASLSQLDEDQPGSDLTGALATVMAEANDLIASHIDAHPETDGMGCTVTALLFDGRRAGLLHVGDSRAYLLRDGTLSQITRDDTYVQSLVDEGSLSADEAHSHPRRSLTKLIRVLTRCSHDLMILPGNRCLHQTRGTAGNSARRSSASLRITPLPHPCRALSSRTACPMDQYNSISWVLTLRCAVT